MQPPRLQPLRKELESAFYHNAPAWVDIPYYFGSGLNYSIYRYMPGQMMRLHQGDEYHLRYYLEELFDGEHYPISLECPLTVLLVIEDDVERGFMLPEPIAPRPFYISEYVLKQYGYYFTYRRKNRETMVYDNWDYFPYLRKYERYDLELLNYADNTNYRYTVVTKDDFKAGWARAAVLMNKKNIDKNKKRVAIKPMKDYNDYYDPINPLQTEYFYSCTKRNKDVSIYSDKSYYPYVDFNSIPTCYPWLCDKTMFNYLEVTREDLEQGWALAVELYPDDYED